MPVFEYGAIQSLSISLWQGTKKKIRKEKEEEKNVIRHFKTQMNRCMYMYKCEANAIDLLLMWMECCDVFHIESTHTLFFFSHMQANK